MPRVHSEAIEIEVEEFIDACSLKDINEIIDYLVESEYINKSQINTYDRIGIPEQELEDALNKLHGKYVSLTPEEETIIKKIANRF